MSSIKGQNVPRRGVTENVASHHEFLYCDSQAGWKLMGTCLITFLGLLFFAIKLPSTSFRMLFFLNAVIVPFSIFLFLRKRVPKQLTADVDDNSFRLRSANELVANFNLSDVLSYKIYNYPFSQYNLWFLQSKGAALTGTGLLIKFKNGSKPLRLYASSMYCNPASLSRFCNAFEKKVIHYNQNAEIEIERKGSTMAHPIVGWVMLGITAMIAVKFFGDLVFNKAIPKSFYGAIASLAGLWIWRNESVKNESRYRKTLLRISRRRTK